jgi:hypothetical protein
MLPRRMLPRLVLFALVATTSSVHAAPTPLMPKTGGAFTLRGKGMRASSTLGGTLVRAADGTVSGDFVIILTSPTDTSTSCRYQKFEKVQRTGNTVSFDGFGSCVTVAPSGAVTSWKAHNAFGLVLGAGRAKDTIDVNMYGPTGITIPGGTLDTGDFQIL